MEVAYDRLSSQTAEFRKDAVKCLFQGVSAFPKPGRHGKRVPPASNPGDLVGSLLQKCPEAPRIARIVGIDLTGSERRAPGLGLLVGANTGIKRLSLVNELFNETVAARPDLV